MFAVKIVHKNGREELIINPAHICWSESGVSMSGVNPLYKEHLPAHPAEIYKQIEAAYLRGDRMVTIKYNN